eukprot:scpid78246/ scgid26851/ 
MDVFLLVAAVASIVLYAVVRILIDLLVVLLIALGGSSAYRLTPGRPRLLMYVSDRAPFLDNVSVNEIKLLVQCVPTADASCRDLAEVQDKLFLSEHVAMFRGTTDGSLRGVVALNERRRRFRAQDIVVVHTCLLAMDPQHGDSGLPYLFYLSRVLALLIAHTCKPVYVLVKLHTAQAYQRAMTTVDEAYPRHSCSTPDFEKALMDEYGVACETDEYRYNQHTGILSSSRVPLRGFPAAAAREEWPTDPHSAYFYAANPGRKEGHGMVVLLKLTPRAVAKHIWRTVLTPHGKSPTGYSNQAVLKSLRRHESISDGLSASKVSSLSTNFKHIVSSSEAEEMLFSYKL